MSAQPSQSLLEIRTLHVLSGDGQMVGFDTIRCPVQRRAVALEQCLSCVYSGGAAKTPAARTEHVYCQRFQAGERPAVPAPPGADAGTASNQTPVWALMTTQVLAVRPDVSLEVLAELCLDRNIGGAPVVDAEGRPIGVVTKTDLVGERFITGDTGEAMGPGRHASRGHYRIELGPGFHAEALPRASVADAMTPVTFTVSEDAPVAQAAALMTVHRVHRAVVVSDDGKVTGIVASSDIMRWLAQQGGYLRPQEASLGPTPES
jgi:CBS domain-containing protein